MTWLENQLAYRKTDANRESCITCDDTFWWWELWMGRCGFCEDDAKRAPTVELADRPAVLIYLSDTKENSAQTPDVAPPTAA